MDRLLAKVYSETSSSSTKTDDRPSQTKPVRHDIGDSPADHSCGVQSSASVHARFSSGNVTIGAGVAIFHLASARVVVCRTRSRRSGREYYFLPKGRRDAHETSTITAAEREGYEESGYRNRVLPLPIVHCQPLAKPPMYAPVSHTSTSADESRDEEEPENKTERVGIDIKAPSLEDELSREALWIELLPLSPDRQYILFWYAAETLPPDVEEDMNELSTSVYQSPPEFPSNTTLRRRMAQDNVRLTTHDTCHSSPPSLDSEPAPDDNTRIYEPVHHENTGVDEDEARYESLLVSIPVAQVLLRGTVMGDVVRRGWEAIQLRIQIEDQMDEQDDHQDQVLDQTRI